MSRTKPEVYTDIGHDDPKAIIWALLGYDFNQVLAGHTWTHEALWGPEIVESWRGRFDPKTGFCSIAPPASLIGSMRRPPVILMEQLQQRFDPLRFFFFSDGVEEFEPNRKRRSH